MTRTFVLADIVIVADEKDPSKQTIYVQDFSFNTGMTEVPAVVYKRLQAKHLRVFTSMKDFMEWMSNYGALVDKCWVV